MKVEFTPQEAQVLINMIDIAVKATGLQAAEAAVVLTKKLQDAAQVEQAPAAEVAE